MNIAKNRKYALYRFFNGILSNEKYLKPSPATEVRWQDWKKDMADTYSGLLIISGKEYSYGETVPYIRWKDREKLMLMIKLGIL